MFFSDGLAACENLAEALMDKELSGGVTIACDAELHWTF
jgi:hypothetical protein